MTCEQGSVDDMTNEDAPEGRVIRFVRPKRPVRVLARTDRRQVEDGGLVRTLRSGRTAAASRSSLGCVRQDGCRLPATLDHRARRSLVLNSALLEGSDC